MTEAKRRRRAIMAEIAKLGFCLPGSVVEHTIRCGKPSCSCSSDDGRLHGPYPMWTRKVGGKTVSKNLSDEQLERYRPWFDNRRRLAELVAELEQLSASAMAAAEAWPEPGPAPADRRRQPRRGGEPAS